MTRSLDEQLRLRPVNEERVAGIENSLRGEVRTARLRDIRATREITQQALAGELKISQNRVSAIEHGQIDKTQVDTLRRYVEALGGRLTIAAQFGSETYLLSDRAEHT
jgi:transcriptional regulator with XRE-family HTH domain